MKIPRSYIKFLRNIAKGVALIAILWSANMIIAFVIFNRETSVSLIIPTWFAVDVSLYIFLFRFGFINRYVNASAVAVILILAILYMVPVSLSAPEEIRALNTSISTAYSDKFKYAKELFFEVEKRWSSPTRQYLLEPHKVFFIKSGTYFWRLEEGEYVDSNVQAHLYRNLLLESGRFEKNEIVVEQHWCTNSPHGVVAIMRGTRTVYADLWAVDNLDEYKFGQYTPPPCDTLTGEPL